MGKWLLRWVGTSLVMAGAIVSACAQFQWPPELLAAPAPPIKRSRQHQLKSEPLPTVEPPTTSSIPPAMKPSIPAGPTVIGKMEGGVDANRQQDAI